MKNLYILLITLFVFAYSNAQIVDIPDVNFRNAMLYDLVVDTNDDGTYDSDVDTNNDGEIQVSEAEAVLSLKVAYKSISSLEGIQSFTNIEHLKFKGNFIDNLDITQNVNLVSIDANNNNFISLNVSQNTNLEELFCAQNEITSLDLTQNVFLNKIRCNSNQLNVLDVSQNVNLIELDISANQITDINLNNLVNLRKFSSADTPLETLDLSQNLFLREIFCRNNNFTSLDLSHNINLRYITANDNQLTSLDVTQNLNLRSLFFPNNNLTSLDLSQNQALQSLHVSNNNIVDLDLSQNLNLTYVYCIGNNLESMNMKNGNNVNVYQCVTTSNSNLFCIQVDDIEIPTNLNGWFQDLWTDYSLDCNLGIEDNTQINFTIYPNPTQDILNIESQQPIESLKIYSLQGQFIKEDSGYSIDVSQLSSGLYFVQVTVEGKTITKKFIKE